MFFGILTQKENRTKEKQIHLFLLHFTYFKINLKNERNKESSYYNNYYQFLN